MREKAAVMVQVREDRDAEDRGDLRNVYKGKVAGPGWKRRAEPP